MVDGEIEKSTSGAINAVMSGPKEKSSPVAVALV